MTSRYRFAIRMWEIMIIKIWGVLLQIKRSRSAYDGWLQGSQPLPSFCYLLTNKVCQHRKERHLVDYAHLSACIMEIWMKLFFIVFRFGGTRSFMKFLNLLLEVVFQCDGTISLWIVFLLTVIPNVLSTCRTMSCKVTPLVYIIIAFNVEDVLKLSFVRYNFLCMAQDRGVSYAWNNF